MTTKELHKMFKGSGTYDALTERYGKTMGYTDAVRFARQHGTTIEELVSEGLELKTRPPHGTAVSIAELLLALGY